MTQQGSNRVVYLLIIAVMLGGIGLLAFLWRSAEEDKSSLQMTTDSQRSQMALLTGEVQVKQERMEELERSEADLVVERADLQNSIVSLEANERAREVEVESLRSELATKTESLEDARSNNVSLQTTTTAYEGEIAGLKSQLALMEAGRDAVIGYWGIRPDGTFFLEMPYQVGTYVDLGINFYQTGDELPRCVLASEGMEEHYRGLYPSLDAGKVFTADTYIIESEGIQISGRICGDDNDYALLAHTYSGEWDEGFYYVLSF